ncbi:MAG: hypothetical protein LBL50_04035, partial [Candidatus Margulisbacteria bacterium]|nr:hypothetical protein [Candidatus Margulisiibacteriota bacterium]
MQQKQISGTEPLNINTAVMVKPAKEVLKEKTIYKQTEDEIFFIFQKARERYDEYTLMRSIDFNEELKKIEHTLLLNTCFNVLTVALIPLTVLTVITALPVFSVLTATGALVNLLGIRWKLRNDLWEERGRKETIESYYTESLAEYSGFIKYIRERFQNLPRSIIDGEAKKGYMGYIDRALEKFFPKLS